MSRDARASDAEVIDAIKRPEIGRSLTVFLKDWVRYVDAAPASESEESMKTVCNAIWQIREIFLKP